MTLQGLIAQAYPSPEWATFFEVSNATGFGASRRADAIALGIWPSRGHKIVGFEFKEDRRDWLRELKNPAKADTIASHCDEWWLVLGAEGIAKPDEIPAPWGLRVASKDRTRLMTVKPCVPFADRDGFTIQRHFAAAMLRKVGENMMLKSEVDRLVQVEVQKHKDRHHDSRELEHVQAELKALRLSVEAFEKASGIAILGGWDRPDRIGVAVKAVMQTDITKRNLQSAHQSVSYAAKVLSDALSALPDDLAVIRSGGTP